MTLKLRKVLASKSNDNSQLRESRRIFVRVAGPGFSHCPVLAPATPWRQSCLESDRPSILGRGGTSMAQRWLSAPWVGKRRRQQRQRVARYFDCKWCSAWGEERARVSSLSPNGCYIETRFSVPPDGEAVRDLTIALPTGRVNLQGTVLNAMSGVGFAVRFIELDTNTRERLSALIHVAQR